MASEVLMTISKDEVERARLMSEYKYELDTQSRIVTAKRQGRAEGETTKAFTIAANLISLNLPLETIITATGLTREEIENLRKK